MMRKMFSFFLYLLVIFCLVTSTASAEKTDFVDKTYDFSKIKSVYLYDVDVELMKSGNADAPARSMDLVEKVMQQDYVDNANKFAVYNLLTSEPAMRKLSLATGKDINKMIADNHDEGSKFFADNLKLIADAYVDTDLYTYKQDYYIIPAHTEWRSHTIYEDYYDKNGFKHTRSRTIQLPEYVPDRRVDVAIVRMRFTLYDAKTGKEIFVREEKRQNDYTSDCRECFRQTVRSFFRDLKKKIKNND